MNVICPECKAPSAVQTCWETKGGTVLNWKIACECCGYVEQDSSDEGSDVYYAEVDTSFLGFDPDTIPEWDS